MNLVDKATRSGLETIFTLHGVLTVYEHSGFQVTATAVQWTTDGETYSEGLMQMNSQQVDLMFRKSELPAFPPKTGDTIHLTDYGILFEVVANDITSRTWITVDRLEEYIRVHAQRIINE